MSWGGVSQWLWPSKQPSTSTVAHDEAHKQPQVDITITEDETKDEEESNEESTPKATHAKPSDSPPAISLQDDGGKGKEGTSSNLHKPSFPAPNSAQRASSATPASKVPSKPSSSPSLMAPPPRPAVNRNPVPSAAAGLRVPTTGPLPNRGPPVNSQQRASGGLAPNGAVKTPNARGKVLLSPGHSPMDWAALAKTGNLSGVSSFQRVKPSQLKAMTGRKGKPAWSSWQGKVYNITPYLPFHPGGEPELMKAAGRDGTKLFMEVHPWVNWENMLGNCLVGALVAEDDGENVGGSSLEDMD